MNGRESLFANQVKMVTGCPHAEFSEVHIQCIVTERVSVSDDLRMKHDDVQAEGIRRRWW